MATFSVSARTVDMLGRQQIAGIPTAISELFKNAHDAYARNVEVDYFRDDGLFVLRDDGLGMTREDFERRWLTLGTDSKIGFGFPETSADRSKSVETAHSGREGDRPAGYRHYRVPGSGAVAGEVGRQALG